MTAHTQSRNRSRLTHHLGQSIIHVFMMIISIGCILPLLLIVSASFSDEADIARYGYSLIPRTFTPYAYSYILRVPSQIIRAYGVTTFVTVVGTALGMLLMSLLAYVISRQDFPWRKQLSFFVFFTMLFNGGLVPWYIWLTQGLHIKDSVWALILPHLIVPWYVLLLRTFFAQLPNELLDAARIDGAGEWRVFFQMILPMSTPSLATVGLFCILMYWNDWYLALLFIDSPKLHPLQYMLYNIMMNARAIQASPQTTGLSLPVNTVRMAMSVLATGPAALIFLALQRYFIRGITVGALK
ncbi:MAG: carbohydrate ABC transporter permease [Chloroflexi bacterium]|jgi:putative aldouronate transport system permease protein|nr:carbohydrate ABC transporter permease [Chloroflexota bacterium]